MLPQKHRHGNVGRWLASGYLPDVRLSFHERWCVVFLRVRAVVPAGTIRYIDPIEVYLKVLPEHSETGRRRDDVRRAIHVQYVRHVAYLVHVCNERQGGGKGMS